MRPFGWITPSPDVPPEDPGDAVDPDLEAHIADLLDAPHRGGGMMSFDLAEHFQIPITAEDRERGYVLVDPPDVPKANSRL